ncbi:50S ribosomal protein L25 [Botrimarina colliarenosi]|uniref:Large ribosomal subunit protein bL25 n=1 Tax=Botrimarina colliarenosi TaxID=2528001 RepID=A0A5C6A5V3_9BACT|nr:50S ribosomal protein L25 [Botrimarina colliarenosi]TWT95334.1 50S ribosomal protein L25 [Botrimarina colliarenosi]
MSDTLAAQRREKIGSRASMRLRAEGLVPAVLYGHKEAAVSLSLQSTELRKSLAHKAKVVNLSGDASGQAIIQALQWDTFHRELLHVDLLRVDAGERVHVTVPLETKGEAVGAVEGGVVTMVVDHIEIEAPPASIPEVLHLDITNLHLGDSMSASQITDLPEGAKLLTDADTVLVHCVPPAGAPALDGPAAASESPEVIAKGGEEEKDGE